MYLYFTLVLSLALLTQGNNNEVNENFSPDNDEVLSGGGSSYGAPLPSDNDNCRLIAGTNNFRAKNGLRPLIGDRRLDDAAKRQCSAMARASELDHSVDGTTPGGRAQSQGYGWRSVAENIYSDKGYGSPKFTRALNAWIKSPGHRKNLQGNYVSVGHAKCVGRDGTQYWVQDFAAGDADPSDQYNCSAPPRKQPKSRTSPRVEVKPSKSERYNKSSPQEEVEDVNDDRYNKAESDVESDVEEVEEEVLPETEVLPATGKRPCKNSYFGKKSTNDLKKRNKKSAMKK